MKPLLEIRRLSKSYASGLFQTGHRTRALAEIDLAVHAGETVGLVGESGCGKTTLARCALLLEAPSEGKVFFDGEDLGGLSAPALRARRREFQIILQDPYTALDPRWNVRRILTEPFEANRLGGGAERERRIAGLLRDVALDSSLAVRLPGELSGGQRQRVAIARALALHPRLLIADEPVSALDASVQAQILNLLGELRQRFGLTMILISHSLPIVRYLCSRVVVMYLGRIVEDAPSDEFFRAPKHPYSKALLAGMPGMELPGTAQKMRLAGEPAEPSPLRDECPFHCRCPEAEVRCRMGRPEMRTVQNGRVACFLYTSDG